MAHRYTDCALQKLCGRLSNIDFHETNINSQKHDFTKAPQRRATLGLYKAEWSGNFRLLLLDLPAVTLRSTSKESEHEEVQNTSYDNH